MVFLSELPHEVLLGHSPSQRYWEQISESAHVLEAPQSLSTPLTLGSPQVVPWGLSLRGAGQPVTGGLGKKHQQLQLYITLAKEKPGFSLPLPVF